MRTAVIPFLVMAIALTGCERKPDRLVTADGRVLSGRLESINGGTVVFENSRTSLERDMARVFLEEEGIAVRGFVSYGHGEFTVTGDRGSVSYQKKEVEAVIWSDPSLDTSVTVEVPASAGWVNTGIRLSPHDRLALRASGRVSVETGTCGPSGLDYYSTAMALVPGATNGQLVMAVGEATPVAAGSTWSGDSPGEGQLRLAVNRPHRESVAGVAGSFSVEVLKTPGILGNSVLYPSKE